MRCKFPDRDLSQRLDSTVCRYLGQPVWVRYAGKQMLTLYSLSTHGKKEVATITSEDPGFDISTVPLGFTQIDNNSVAYVTRRPTRMYKQGLSTESISVRYLNNNFRSTNFSLISPAFERSILNQYPSLQQAFDILRRSENPMEIAISRDIALRIDPTLKLIYIFFKTESVGWVPPDSNTVIIPSSELAWVVSKYLNGFSWQVE